LGFSSFSGRRRSRGTCGSPPRAKALVAINHVFDGEVSDRYLPTADQGGRGTGSSRRRCSATTSPSTSSLSTSIPVSPLDTASATLPTRVATTGRAASCLNDRQRKALRPGEQGYDVERGGWGGDRPPRRVRRSLTPRSAAASLALCVCSPSPRMTTRDLRRSQEDVVAFHSVSRPTLPTTKSCPEGGAVGGLGSPRYQARS